MKPTRPRTLLLVVVAAAVVSWAVLTAIYNSLPPLTWTGVPALLIAAGVETWAGRDLRNRIHGVRGARPAPPLFVARIVALAKASSQVAALLAGICAGFMVYLSGMTSDPTPRADLVDATLSFAASLMLMAAALFLEYCCRVPGGPDPDGPDPDGPSGRRFSLRLPPGATCPAKRA